MMTNETTTMNWCKVCGAEIYPETEGVNGVHSDMNYCVITLNARHDHEQQRAKRAEADLAAANARAEAAEQRVTELEAAQGWRPVTETPQKKAYYLGWTGVEVVWAGYWPGHYWPESSAWVDEVGLDLPITHWRPLPAPPDASP